MLAHCSRPVSLRYTNAFEYQWITPPVDIFCSFRINCINSDAVRTNLTEGTVYGTARNRLTSPVRRSSPISSSPVSSHSSFTRRKTTLTEDAHDNNNLTTRSLSDNKTFGFSYSLHSSATQLLIPSTTLFIKTFNPRRLSSAPQVLLP